MYSWLPPIGAESNIAHAAVSTGGERRGRILEPPPKARSAAVCGAPAAAARRGHAFWDHSATLGIRTCCGWSFGHSRGPVVVPRCAPAAPEGELGRDCLARIRYFGSNHENSRTADSAYRPVVLR